MSDNIVRVHRHEKSYTTIENATMRDPRLNAKERGVLATILSLPPSWQIRFNALVRDYFPEDGRDAIRSAFQRLIQTGYMTLERRDPETGRLGESVYTVFEIPLHTDPVDRKPSRKRKEPINGKSVSGAAPTINGKTIHGKSDPINKRLSEIKDLKTMTDDKATPASADHDTVPSLQEKGRFKTDKEKEQGLIDALRGLNDQNPFLADHPLTGTAFRRLVDRVIKKKLALSDPLAFLLASLPEEIEAVQAAQLANEARKAARRTKQTGQARQTRQRPALAVVGADEPGTITREQWLATQNVAMIDPDHLRRFRNRWSESVRYEPEAWEAYLSRHKFSL